MGIESWSTIAGSNNQAPPNGWPGGMLPSQVEPTARQMMASLATWYQAAQWINYNFTPVYVSSTQFTIAGNVTSTYHVGRRVQATDGSTSVYGTITASAFTTLTTVTVTWDTGVLQTGVTIVYVGIISKVNSSIPAPTLVPANFANPSATIGLTAVNGTATTAMTSDSAPPLSQAISPTWTGTHRFSTTPVSFGANYAGGATPFVGLGSAGGTGNFVGSYDGTHEALFGTSSAGGFVGSFSNHQFEVRTNNTQRILVGASGSSTFNAPSSGSTIVTQAAANANSIQCEGNATSGQSFGLRVDAGTNSSDECAHFYSSGGGTKYFNVRGDGLVQAIDQGGALQDVGWRVTPQNVQNGNYTLALSDRGKSVQWQGTTNTYTVPANIFAGGDVVSIINASAGVSGLTIAAGTGLTLFWANGSNTTGNRTLTGIGMATVYFFSTTVAFISGSGLS